MQKGKSTAAEVQPLSRRPLTAYHGLTRGVCRTALLLMLASWLGGCDASGTPSPPPPSPSPPPPSPLGLLLRVRGCSVRR